MNPTQQASQQSVPEAQVGPQIQQSVTPDLVNQQGQQALAGKLAQTNEKKQFLDYILKGIAEKTGAEFSSRVKNPETVVQKVASKRMEGRKYGLDDVNDVYGGRFVIKNSSEVAPIKKMLDKAQELGVFKIGKQEERTQATYHAHHLDITTSDGVRGEIQIMTPQEELEAVSNHGLRAVHGEKPPPDVASLRDKQAELASKIPNAKAHEKAQQIQAVAKSMGDKPLDVRIPAAILTHREGTK
jgi:ppGpp synthetase/RelA/SpoT-type nucleotidyltranferase